MEEYVIKIKKMIDNVIKIIQEIVTDNGDKPISEITMDSKLRDLGLSSFDLATLTVRIEDEFDVDIFEDGLVDSVGEIVSILEENA
jgi:acyl carrier protein